ncbi:unnamed protein product [Chrysoparadoxa australica]
MQRSQAQLLQHLNVFLQSQYAGSGHGLVADLAALSAKVGLQPELALGTGDRVIPYVQSLDGLAPKAFLQSLPQDSILPVVEDLLMHLKLSRQLWYLVQRATEGPISHPVTEVIDCFRSLLQLPCTRGPRGGKRGLSAGGSRERAPVVLMGGSIPSRPRSSSANMKRRSQQRRRRLLRRKGQARSASPATSQIGQLGKGARLSFAAEQEISGRAVRSASPALTPRQQQQQIDGLQELSNAINTVPDNEGIIFQVMCRYPVNTTLHARGLQLIEKRLKAAKPGRSLPGSLDHQRISLILDSMRQFRCNSEIQASGVACLASYIDKDESNIIKLAADGGFLVLLQAMEALGSNEKVQVCGCGILGSPSICSDEIVRLDYDMSIKLLLAAMEAFPLSEKIQGLSSLALANLVVKNEACIDKVGISPSSTRGTLLWTIESLAMPLNMGESSAEGASFSRLCPAEGRAMLTDCASLPAQLLEAEAVHVIAAALLDMKESPLVQSACCWSLGLLVSKSQELCRVVLELGGQHLAVQALDAHPDAGSVTTNATYLIEAIEYRTQELEDGEEEEGEMSAAEDDKEGCCVQ